MENIDTIDFILYTALAFVCAYILFKVWGSKTFEKICDITLDCLGFIYFVITLGNYPYDTRKVKHLTNILKERFIMGLEHQLQVAGQSHVVIKLKIMEEDKETTFFVESFSMNIEFNNPNRTEKDYELLDSIFKKSDPIVSIVEINVNK